MKPITRIKYTGTALPTDSDTFVLFDSTTLLPTSKAQGVLQACGIRRFNWGFLCSHDGVLELDSTDDGGVTWRHVTEVNVDGGTATTRRGSFDVENFQGFRVRWVNGGTTQTTFEPDLSLSSTES